MDSITDLISDPSCTLATIIDTVGMGTFARSSNAIPRAMEVMRRPTHIGRPKLRIFTDGAVIEQLLSDPELEKCTYEPRIDFKTKDFYFDHYTHEAYILISCHAKDINPASLDRLMSAYPRSYNTKGGSIQKVKPQFVYWHFTGGLTKEFQTELVSKYGAESIRPTPSAAESKIIEKSWMFKLLNDNIVS